LSDADYRANRFNYKNIRVVIRFDSSAGIAESTGRLLRRDVCAEFFFAGNISDAIAGHGENHGCRSFTYAFNPCKKKGVGDGPFVKEGG